MERTKEIAPVKKKIQSFYVQMVGVSEAVNDATSLMTATTSAMKRTAIIRSAMKPNFAVTTVNVYRSLSSVTKCMTAMTSLMKLVVPVMRLLSFAVSLMEYAYHYTLSAMATQNARMAAMN